MLRFLFALSLAISGGAGAVAAPATRPASPPTIEELLPEGKLAVDALIPDVSPRVQDLLNRLQQSMKGDSNWVTEKLKTLKPGEPLPWDSRSGMSRDEWKEFMQWMDHPQYKKDRSFEITVVRHGDTLIIAFGELPMPRWPYAVIDLSKRVLTTPYGASKDCQTTLAKDDRKFFNQWPWDGYEWTISAFGKSPGQGRVVSFAVGRLWESGRGIIYCSVDDTTIKPPLMSDYHLQFDLKKK